MQFGRLITAMVTPFDEHGAIDWDATGALIDYLIEEQQSDSLVVSGTTGESPTLTDAEKEALYRFAVQRAAGRCKIIAGTGSNETAHSVHLTKIAEKCGVDGALLVVPYYNKPTQEGIYQHFKAIADGTSLPIMLYNVPGRTIVSMTAETTLRLAQISNIVATKECGSLELVSQIIAGAPEGFTLYTGDDSAGLPVLSIGGYGIVSVASHLVGKQMQRMMKAYSEGQVEEAKQLHHECFPLFKGLFELPNPVLVKAALQEKGIRVGGVRLPLVVADEASVEALKKILP